MIKYYDEAHELIEFLKKKYEGKEKPSCFYDLKYDNEEYLELLNYMRGNGYRLFGKNTLLYLEEIGLIVKKRNDINNAIERLTDIKKENPKRVAVATDYSEDRSDKNIADQQEMEVNREKKDIIDATKSVDFMDTIKILQNKYPAGSPFYNAVDLIHANLECVPSLITLMNQSTELVGMPLSEYLVSIGLIKSMVEEKTRVKEKTQAHELKTTHDFQSALILYKSKILSQFFEEKEIKDILSMYDEDITDDCRGEIKLSKSFSKSLENMVSLIIKNCKNSNLIDWDDVELEDLYKLECFLNIYSAAIDREIEGEIIITSSFEEAEDEYQALRYQGQDCELVRWRSDKKKWEKKNQHIANYCVYADANVVTVDKLLRKSISVMEYAREHGEVLKFTRAEKNKNYIRKIKKDIPEKPEETTNNKEEKFDKNSKNQQEKEEKIQKEETYRIYSVKVGSSAKPIYAISKRKYFYVGQFVELLTSSGEVICGEISNINLCTKTTLPCDIEKMNEIKYNIGREEYLKRLPRNFTDFHIQENVYKTLNIVSKTLFEKVKEPIKIDGKALWACCRGIYIEVLYVLQYLAKKDDIVYQLNDIIFLNDEVAELQIYGCDVEDVLRRFPNVKMLMFVENRDNSMVSVCYSRSGYNYITDETKVGKCDYVHDRWTLKHSPAESRFSANDVEYVFAYSDDWEAINYVYNDDGIAFQMRK